MSPTVPSPLSRPIAWLAMLVVSSLGLGVLGLGAVGSLTPAAGAARPDHAPGAPTRLTVEDRTDPLAVTGTPRFGWLPHDRDGDEQQTAYEIVVRRDGARVWDSGRVASSRQSWVAYNGPRLTAGASYAWTVRTWDRRHRRSPWARTATFGAGLGDHDWSGAQWIRRETSGNDAANDWTLARKQLQVSSGSRVVRARAYVAAMGDWAVDVDGRRVQHSSSYAYPGEGYYDVADLGHVQAGQQLAVGVLYHYWTCRCQGRANGPQPPEGPSGLLVKVVVDHADGSQDVMVSNGSWKVAKDEAETTDTLTYRNGDAGDRVEYVDATRAQTGWDTVGYDDSGWAAPQVIGPHPRPAAASCVGYEGDSSPCTFSHLVARQAHVVRHVVHPVSVRRLADGDVFADFGRVSASVPAVHLEHGTAGRQITLTTSYRRTNSTLTRAVRRGARVIALGDTGDVHAGDQIVVDAPADGYGPGDPETRVVRAVDGQRVRLSSPLHRAHASGDWVESSRAGTSGLDTQGSDMRFVYTERDGAQTARPFTYWGWRYVQISDPGERLTKHDITAVVQHVDVPAGESSTFHSGNATLDRVYRLMQRSALQSEQNVFLDTPTREKGQFLGDTVDESFATMTASHERSLTRQAMVAFIESQNRYWDNGAMNAVYPNGDAKRDIPDYTEMFPGWVLRYYETTGDRSMLRRALPAMRKVADYISTAIDQHGLVSDLPGGSGPYLYGIIDWPAPMRYDNVVDGNRSRTVVNALGVDALRSVSGAARVLGRVDVARTYGTRATRLVSALRSTLRDPATGRWSDGVADDGSVIDSHSQHAQTYAIDYGLNPSVADGSLGRYVASLGMRQGPMDLRQLLEALRVSGHPGAMVSLLTDPSHDGPAQVLAEGGTFMWEQWTPGCDTAGCARGQVNQDSSESMSHGWGGAGVVGVLEGLLGVTVTSPGAATVRIQPAVDALRHARGTQWTERGPVRVSWTGPTHRQVRVGVPTNVHAVVALPREHGRRYRVTGNGSAHLLRHRDGMDLWRVGSGTTRFVSVG